MSKTMNTSLLKTLPEAVSYLQTSPAGLYRMIDHGQLAKPVRRGGRAIYRWAYIEGVAHKTELEAIDVELGF